MASDDLRALVGAKLLHMAREYHEASDLDVDFDEAAARVSGSWIVDGVMAVLDEAQRLNDDAWGSVWLHGKWSWLTKCMTTEEREYAADCVARWSARLEPDEPGEPEGLRWWRTEPPCGYCGCTIPAAECTTCRNDEAS